MVADIKGEEIGRAVKEIVEKVKNNPVFMLEHLYNVAAIIMTVGLTKNIPSLKVIGNYIFLVPSKYRPLLAYRYQLIGSTEELEEKVGKQITETLGKVLGIIEEIAKIIAEKEQIKDEDFIKHMGDLETILSGLPAFST